MIINDLDDYYIIFDTKNRNTELDTLNIKQTRCSVELFENVLKRTGYTIENRIAWFINPHYEVKFGLKPRKLYMVIDKLPYIRNFFTTSSFYVLKK